MVKLTMYSLSTTVPGQLVATPAADQPAASSSSSDTAGPRSSLPSSAAKVKDAGGGPIGGSPARRVSPRKPKIEVKYEEADDDDADLGSVGAVRASHASVRKRSLPSASLGELSDVVASSSKPADASPSPPRKKAEPSFKKPRRTSAQASGSATDAPISLPPPPRWRETYDAIADMRKGIVAPVDGMGCAAAGDREVDPVLARFAILVSLMLSSQTKDEMTHRAVEKLRSDLPGGLSALSLSDAPDALVRACISCVGFANRKTEYIKAAAVDCLEKHAGDIPRDLAGLLALKGVGPKMAYLVLENAWSESLGIGVDIHVERITNRLGWHPAPTNKPNPNPELARRNLEAWLPTELWRPVNPLLVGFGQTICKAVLPRCGECTLGPKALCPSYDPSAAGKARVKAEKLARVAVKQEAAGASAVAVVRSTENAKPRLEIGLEQDVDIDPTASLVKMEPKIDL